MSIAFISAVFPPEPLTGARTAGELAADLAHRGQPVTVITCFPSRPGGHFYAGCPVALRRCESSPEGFQVQRVPSIPCGDSGGLLARAAESLSFGMTTAVALITTNPDAIVVNSWPIFANGIVVLLAGLRGIPVAVTIQDIHPEAIVAAGGLRGRPGMVRVLQALDGLVARHASAVVVISEGFRRFYEERRRVAPDRLHVICNWMDEVAIAPGDRDGPFRRRLGLGPDDFVVMYAGNIGALASVGTVLEAADRLRGERGIVFVIAGGGSDLDRCREFVAARALRNVRFHSPWTSEPVAEVHAAADVLVLPKRTASALTSVPSKLIGYLLSGRPVIAAVEPDSDTAQILEDSHSGVSVPPEDPAALAAAILRFRESPPALAAMGRNAREYAVAHFSRAACLPRLSALVESLALAGARKRREPNRALFAVWTLSVTALVVLSIVNGLGGLRFQSCAYALTGGLALASFGLGPRGLSVALLLLPLSIVLEAYQFLAPGRTFEPANIAAATAGIAAALALSLLPAIRRATG